MEVKKIANRVWLVKNKYRVWIDRKGFSCTCIGYICRLKPCKHIKAVIEYIANKKLAGGD